MRIPPWFNRLPISLVTALAVVSLAACSGDNGGSGGDNILIGDEEVSLVFTWWGDDSRAAITQQAIDKFMADNPGIIVEGAPRVMDGYFDTLAAETASQEAPDVITLDRGHLLDYAKNDAIMDLKALSDVDLTAFSTGLLTHSSTGGGVYGVPTGANTLVILANLDVFEAAGVALPDDNAWTWEEFAEIATQITARTPDGTYGAELRCEDVIDAYVGQRGESLYSLDGQSVIVPAAILAQYWTMALDLMKSGGAAPAELQDEVRAGGPAKTLAGRGQAAMITGYDNQLQAYATAAGANFGLLRPPGESQYKRAGALLNPSQYYAVWGGTQHPVEAAKFVNFLVNDPAVGLIIGADRGMPSNPDVRSAAEPTFNEYQKADSQFLDRIQAHIAGTHVPPPTGAQNQDDLSRELDGQVLFERLTPQAAAEQWIERMQASIDGDD